LLFVGNATTDRGDPEPFSFTTGTFSNRPVSLYVPFVGMGSTINPLAPDSAHAFVKILTQFLLIGPRETMAAVRCLLRAWWAHALDAESCAAVLAVLVENRGSVPFSELTRAVPAGRSARAVLGQVQDINGVRLDTEELEGLSLSPTLRKELRKLGGSRTKGRTKEPEANDKKPQVSLVLLLREPRDLDMELLTQLINETFYLDLGQGDPKRTEFVRGEAPMFFAQFQGHLFHVLAMPDPYFPDVQAVSNDIKELRLRKAVAEHRAWLSVDLMMSNDDAPREPYWYIGKLLTALAPGDTLAVYWPEGKQLRVWERGLRKQFAEGEPLAALAAAPEKVPVVEIAEEDPRMKAAVAEARRRWPEFVTAFARRRPEQKFAVKAGISDGRHVEYLWLTVQHLKDGIHGQVDNEPVELTSVCLGSKVRVPVEELTDWLYTDGDEMKGGFTVKVIQELNDR
jgi:uncharacterized protein YegJ (DUF2314 family)